MNSSPIRIGIFLKYSILLNIFQALKRHSISGKCCCISKNRIDKPFYSACQFLFLHIFYNLKRVAYITKRYDFLIHCTKEQKFILNCDQHMIFDFICYRKITYKYFTKISAMNNICAKQNASVSDLRFLDKVGFLDRYAIEISLEPINIFSSKIFYLLLSKFFISIIYKAISKQMNLRRKMEVFITDGLLQAPYYIEDVRKN